MINPSGRVVAVADSRVQECLGYGFKMVETQTEEVKATKTQKKAKQEVIEEEPAQLSDNI